MILSDIRDYVKKHGQVSLADLVNHFDSEPSAMDAMLQRWIDRKLIKKTRLTASCGDSCQQCDVRDSVLYTWVDTKKAAIDQPLYHLPFNCKG
ncbi:MAG: FeoC-like transcriptional regulator [Gammaproteobacteria bacterium]|nr:FeoC-like transcriptional regulator [Gammaproteobacteria bacterium]